MSVSRYTLTVQDASIEGSTVACRGVALDAANFAAMITLFAAFKSAVEDVIDGGYSKVTIVALQEPIAGTPGGARELKWLVRMTDANGFAVSMEIPTADQSLCVPGTDLMDISAGVGLALKAAIEAVHKGREDSAVTVQQVRLVGRNL